MTGLLVLKALGDDSAESPEFQYLLSLVLLHARPYRLADTGLAGRFPVYTLRGYERLESAFLEEGPGNAPPPPPSVALLTWDEYRRRSGTPVHAGLCHEFIDYYGEVRDDVLPFLPEGAREVLEVGCRPEQPAV